MFASNSVLLHQMQHAENNVSHAKHPAFPDPRHLPIWLLFSRICSPFLSCLQTHAAVKINFHFWSQIFDIFVNTGTVMALLSAASVL